VLGGLLVDIGLAVVCLLIELVTDGITGSLGTGAEAGVAVFGDVLVGLLGGSGARALDGLADVVDGVLDGIHGERWWVLLDFEILVLLLGFLECELTWEIG